MATVKAMVEGMPNDNEATAGPGHKPDIPQPIPNVAAPMTRCESTDVLAGKRNVASSTGLSILREMIYPIAEITTAPPRTNARLGSHAPNPEQIKIDSGRILAAGSLVEAKSSLKCRAPCCSRRLRGLVKPAVKGAAGSSKRSVAGKAPTAYVLFG